MPSPRFRPGTVPSSPSANAGAATAAASRPAVRPTTASRRSSPITCGNLADPAVDLVDEAARGRIGQRVFERYWDNTARSSRGSGQWDAPVGVLVDGARLVLLSGVTDQVGEADREQPAG